MAVQKRRNREGLLDADGVCAPGEVAAPNDILVNRQTPLNTKDVVPGMGHGDAALGDADYKPTPLAWKGPPGQNVVVDKVLLTNNEEGHMVVKARPRRKICGLPVCMRGILLQVCAGACKVLNMICNVLFTLHEHSLDSAHEQGLTASRFSTSLQGATVLREPVVGAAAAHAAAGGGRQVQQPAWAEGRGGHHCAAGRPALLRARHLPRPHHEPVRLPHPRHVHDPVVKTTSAGLLPSSRT